jgi:hypothetical protein
MYFISSPKLYTSLAVFLPREYYSYGERIRGRPWGANPKSLSASAHR